MKFKTPSREEILTGPPLRTMARIGGPAVISSLIFTLYNLADAFWIGRLPKAESAAAVAGIQVSWPIVWFLISFISGFGGAAVSALVAQYVGAGRPKEANYALNQLLSLSAVSGIMLGVAGYFLSPWLLALLIGEGTVASAASLYIQIIFLGLPTMVLPGLFYSALAATGDTLTPLLVNGGGTLLNMALDPLLVLGWGPVPRMGILGAAYATVAAQGLVMLAFLALLWRGKGLLRLDPSALLPWWGWMVKGLRIGVPAAIGQSSMAFGFVIMTAVIGRLPNAEAALAGYGIGDRVLGILFIVTEGLGTGLTTMVGQALGAGAMDRAQELVRKGLRALIVILAAEAGLLWLIRYPAVAMFIPGREDVIELGARFIGAFAVSMPFLGTFFAAMAIYRGSGHNVPTMVLGVVRLWVLRIPLSYLFGFPLGLGADGVWWGMSLSNVIAGLIALGFLLSRSWQRSVVEESKGIPG
ncbi:MAG: MATE family efflux transporter [Candidatus Acetothermia bacterium]|jgi:putative MATE family efflux protein|nr:MATE family efflux transporter [Candidatus Acetothermia bacterium]